MSLNRWSNYSFLISCLICFVAIVLSFLPFFLNFDFNSVDNAGNHYSGRLPLQDSISSESYKLSLVSCIAVSAPIILDFLVDCLSSESFSQAPILSKVFLLISVLVPNVVVLIFNSQLEFYYSLFPSLSSSRNLVLILSLVIGVGFYGNPIWTPRLVLTMQGLISVGFVTSALRAFSLPLSTLYGLAVLKYILYGSTLFIFLYTTVIWIKYLMKDPQHWKSFEGYCCNLYLLSAYVSYGGFLSSTLMYRNVTWAQSGPDFLCLINYLQASAGMVVLVVYGRMSRRINLITRLKEELDTKSAFVRYISHEIRTPLNTVVMGLRYLHNDVKKHASEEPEWVEVIEDLEKSCESAVEILNDLLIYDKLKTNILQGAKESVAVKPFLDDIIHHYAIQAKDTGIELHVHYSSELLTATHKYIEIDPHKISRVFQKLLSNGLKFTKRGGSLLVRVSTVRKEAVADHHRADKDDGNTYNARAKLISENIRTAFQSISEWSRPILPELTHGDSADQLPRSMVIDESGSVVSRRNPGTFSAVLARGATQQSRNHSSPALMVGIRENADEARNNVFARSASSLAAGGSLGADSAPGTPRRRSAYTLRDAVRNFDFSSSESLHKQAEVESGRKHNFLRIEVIDDGPGITEENQKRLFKEIIQFNPGELQDGKGSGLGLWIAHQIMGLHSGFLRVYSRGVNCGSTFIMELPLSSTDPSPARLPKDSKNVLSARLLMRMQRSAMFAQSPPVSPWNNRIHPFHSSLPSSVVNSVANSAANSAVNSLPSSAPSSAPNSNPQSSSSQQTPFNPSSEPVVSEEGRPEDSKRSAVDEVTPVMMSEDPMPTSRSNGTDLMDYRFGPGSRRTSTATSVRERVSSLFPMDIMGMFGDEGEIFPQARVLIVDDAKLNRSMMRRLLKENWSDISEAEDGEVAVHAVKESIVAGAPFDIILMDYQMPRMDGPPAAQLIRQMGFTGFIIGITGNALPVDIQTYMDHGADHVLLKPLQLEQLYSCLRELILRQHNTTEST